MPNKNIVTRAQAVFQPQTVRDNSIEFVLATENPADVIDWSRGEIISESLVSDGFVLPPNKQIPLLDCHQRDGVSNILGSVREIRLEDNKVIGRLYFSKSAKSQETFEKVKEGHIDSGSVGYSQAESTWIPDGESYVYKNREFKGPLLLTTRWNLHEFSLVPVPADSNAKARELTYLPAIKAEQITATAIRSKIVSNCAMEAADNNIKEDSEMETENKLTESVNVDEITRAAAKKATSNAAAILNLCERHNCRDLAEHMISEGLSIEAAQKVVLDELATRSQALSAAKPTIEVKADETDKFRAAAVDGLLLRSGLRIEKAAAGASDFRTVGIKGLARELARRDGKQFLSDEECVKYVLRAGSQASTDFSYILDAGMNKSVMQGYNNAASTWKLFTTTGSLDNLEVHNRVALADMPDLEVNPEGAEIKSATISDRGEKVQLVTYAKKVALTRKAILADDLSLFSNIARMFGYRAAQKIEALAYGVLTGSKVMSDNKTLFHADHKNLAASSAALSKASLAAAYSAIRKQTDINGSKLGIMPKFLLVSPDDAVEAEVLTKSMTDVSSNIALGNSNFFKNHSVVAIDSPYIENSFFVIADPNGCPTIEMSFLQGKETPTIEEIYNDGDILGKKWLCYIDIGASALDFRGMYKTPTA